MCRERGIVMASKTLHIYWSSAADRRLGRGKRSSQCQPQGAWISEIFCSRYWWTWVYWKAWFHGHRIVALARSRYDFVQVLIIDLSSWLAGWPSMCYTHVAHTIDATALIDGSRPFHCISGYPSERADLSCIPVDVSLSLYIGRYACNHRDLAYDEMWDFGSVLRYLR